MYKVKVVLVDQMLGTAGRRAARARGATEHMRLVERFTRLDANTVNYRLTVTDPATFASPWTLENSLRKADSPVYAFACHEGNYGLTGILAGVRAEEKR